MAVDIFHNAVKNALDKENWAITREHMLLRVNDVDMYVDLAAEKLITAEREHKKIAIEVKSFLGPSHMTEFHAAVGQYGNYQDALEEIQPDRELYLAVPNEVYRTFFQRSFIKRRVNRLGIKLLIYHPEEEIILEWKK